VTVLSVKKLFKNDYLVILAVICSTVPCLLYLLGSTFGFMFGRHGVVEVSATELRGWPFWIAVIAGVSVVVLISRVVWINGILESGSTVSGCIDKVWHDRDRGRIEYEYTFQGRTYRSWTAISVSADNRHLKKGDTIEVVVDQNHPQRALLKQLYV